MPTPGHRIDQLLVIGEQMKAKLQDYADDLRDEEEGFVVRLYERELAEIETLLDHFSRLRLELQGHQPPLVDLETSTNKPAPAPTPLDQQLAARIMARDTDPAEALLQQDQDAPQPHPSKPSRPIIQDGKRLAAALSLIAERLIDRNWRKLNLHSSEHATDLIEACAALEEFGA